MFLMEVEASFEAGHRLPNYNGPCQRMHGHSYVVWATWGARQLDNQGIAIDLVVLKNILRSIVQPFDHQETRGTKVTFTGE